MAATATAARSYSGSAPEPVVWGVLEGVFDAIFGRELHDLKRWPETMHNVHAGWKDAEGVAHEAQSLDDVREAYGSFATFCVTFSGWREGGKPCSFSYWPGVQARAEAFAQGPPNDVEGMIAPVREAFPLQRRVVFLSWAGERSKVVADALRIVIQPRLPRSAEVFFSPQIRPGAAPLVEMLDKNLLVADLHVVVLTSESVRHRG